MDDAELSTAQLEAIIKSLRMRINYIQTGDVVLSPTDCQNMGRSDKIRPITEEQMRLVIKMSDTIKQIESILETHKKARLIGTWATKRNLKRVYLCGKKNTNI